MADITDIADLDQVVLEDTSQNDTTKESQKFTQLEGLQKTYAHYLLFKENSPTLKKVIEIFVPDNKDRQKLFIEIFTVLNKKHVKAGLKQFGAIPNIGISGFSKSKYIAMSEYGNIGNIKNLFNTIDREIYENKFLIDAIHETVIHYFPKDGAISNTTDQEDKDIIQAARKNLQKSLNGYIGTTRKEYITALNDPLEKIGDLDKKLKDIKTDVIDKLPNVLELEAVAELHRHAFLTVDKKDALELIADSYTSASSNVKPDNENPSEEGKILYVYFDKKSKDDEYMVSSIKLNDKFKKYTKKNNGCWTEEKGGSKGGTKHKSKSKSTKKARTRGI